jgi:putative membrane protein insertion efficiency factor
VNSYRLLLNFYQKFISPIFGPSCRYYPSCSEYAKWQFDLNPAPLAFLMSFFRICRCNKLFIGGIDYPTINFTPPKLLQISNSNIKIKYWIVRQKILFVAVKTLK